jgi:hypothetical protein
MERERGCGRGSDERRESDGGKGGREIRMESVRMTYLLTTYYFYASTSYTTLQASNSVLECPSL